MNKTTKELIGYCERRIKEAKIERTKSEYQKIINQLLENEG